MDLLIEQFPNKPWNWKKLSSNSSITWTIVSQNIDKEWDWKALCQNSAITFDDFLQFPLDNQYWDYISKNKTITLDTPTTVFDNCGFKITNYLSKYTDKGYVIPSVLFHNATDFLNKMDFPFFEDYTFEIFDDSKLSPEDQEIVEQFCFKSSFFLRFSIFIILIISIILL